MRRTLVLGGTAWLGRELVAQLLAGGDEVTCVARGASGTVPSGASLVETDRSKPDAYEAVAGVAWDEVIELCYEPELAGGALRAIGDSAKHWTLISSVSVYASNSEPGADESAPLCEASDPSDYSSAKVAAELASTEALGDRLLIVRPGLIAGPGDPSDRCGYWPARFALAQTQAVLTPHTCDGRVQIVDVRDLAAWVVTAGGQGITGTFNAVGESLALADVLATEAQLAGHTGEVLAADDEWMLAHGVNYWAGPHSLPLWLPVADVGFTQRSNARYLDAGGRVRDLADTLADVLADERERGLDRVRRSGLTRAEELALIAALRAG